MIKNFFSLYLGMLVVNLVSYLVSYEHSGNFNFVIQDLFSPIPYASIGTIILYIMNKLNIKNDNEGK